MIKQMKSFEGRPYSISEIPKFNIDYRGLIKYAKNKNCKVFELTDSEKELFTNGTSMDEIREKMLI